jgi:Ca2+-binding RTX toxin-like protein
MPVTNWNPVGSERQVNLSTAGIQQDAEVVGLADGRFLVAYENEFDTGEFNTLLQLFDSDGDPVGTAMDVSAPFVIELNPALALGENGVAIVYETPFRSSGPTTGNNIRVATFNPATLSFGTDLEVVNSDRSAHDPDIAAFSNGDQAIVFEFDFTLGDHDIYVRLLDDSGTSFSTENLVVNDATSLQAAPAVAASGSRALIVYEDNTLGGSTDIRANLYSRSTGAGLGKNNAFTIANDANNPLIQPDVAALANGDYVVVYVELDAIRGRIYDPSDGPTTPPEEFRIASGAGVGQPSVAALPDGGFVVAWQESRSNGLDIFQRRFDDSGVAIGDEFRVNTNTASNQAFASVAANPFGQTFTAWDNAGSSPDTQPTGVQGHAAAITNVNIGTSGADDLDGYAIGETINGREGNDKIYGNGGNDRLLGSDGNDTVEGGTGADELSGGNQNDTLRGGDSKDKLSGGDGADKLFGDKSDDTLSGGTGRDTLTGGLGRDVISGGADKDVFDFNSISESPDGSNRDVIESFQRGTDDIDLRTIDAKTGVSGNNGFKFIGTDSFKDVKGELRIKDLGSQVIVQADVNGNGNADFEIKVNAGSLAKSDFLL